MENKLYTKKEFADKFRPAFGEELSSIYSDDQIIDRVLLQFPEYANVIKQPELSYESYDPSFGDHMNKALFNFTSMGINLAPATTGFAAATVGNFVNYVTGDDELKNNLLNYSEKLRSYTKDYLDNYIESDPSIQAYLMWNKDKPFSFDNFWHGDMLMRGMTDLAPSIVSMMIPTGTVAGGLKLVGTSASKIAKISGYTSLGTISALHGSSEYTDAMEYLVDDKEGPRLTPQEAFPIASTQSAVTAMVGGAIEKFGIDKTAKAFGISNPLKTFYTKPIADRLLKEQSKSTLKSVGRFGINVSEGTLTSGIQEGTEAVLAGIQQKARERYTGTMKDVEASFADDLVNIIGDPEIKQGFYTGVAGSLVIGGAGGITSAAAKRFIDNRQNKLDEDIQYDIGNKAKNIYSPTDIRTESAIRAADFIGQARDDEGNVVDAIRSNETLNERAVNILSSIVQEGPEFFDNANINPNKLFNKINEEINYSLNVPQDLYEQAFNIANQSIVDVSQTPVDVGDPRSVFESIEDFDETAETDVVLDSKVITLDEKRKLQKEKAKLEKEERKANEEWRDVADILENEGIKRNSAKYKSDPRLIKAKNNFIKAQLKVQEINLKLLEEQEVKTLSGKIITRNYKNIPEYKETKDRVNSLKSQLKPPVKEGQQDLFNYQKVNTKNLSKNNKKIINKANMELNALAGLGLVKVIRHKTDPNRIGDIEVPESKRGQGVGTRVINNFKKIFIAEGKDKIKVVAKPGSEGFYRKQGFYSIGVAKRKVKNPVTGEMQYPTIMELPLTRPDDKIIDNRDMANQIANRLSKKFKWIKAKEVEQVFDRDGREVAGRAFNDIVEWSRTKGTLDTIPHEYAHIYVRLMKNSPIINEGIKRFGSEEKLVQYIGEYYTNKMTDKGLISRIKTWLRKYTNELKKFFGAAMTDKDVANLISERFYSFKMKETDKKALKENVMYQSVQESLFDTEGKSNNNIDNTLDNEGFIDESEVSAKSDISTLINNVKTLLNIPLTKQEDAMLREAARLKPFEEFKQTDLKQIFDKNNRDVFDLSQNDLDELKRFSIFVKNAIPINREDTNDSSLINVKAFKDPKGNYTFQTLKKNDIEYTPSGYPFEKQQPQWTTNFIAHQYPHIAKLFEDMIVLNKEKVFIESENKFFKSRFFLNKKELNSFTQERINITGKPDKYLPMFSRGDRPKMFFGKIKSNHTEIAKNKSLYKKTIQALKNKGYFENSDVFKQVLNLNILKNREEFLATFDYINQIIPGWTNLKFEEVLKRIKIPLTPAFTSPDTPDANVKFIKAENIRYKYKDTINKNGKVVQGLEFNMSDGDTMTSRSYVKKVADIFGLNRNVGWLKSVIYDINNIKTNNTTNNLKDVDLLMVKHQNSIPEDGVEIYDGNSLVAVVNNGEIQSPDSTKTFDMILTDDEAKIRNGKYDTDEFTVPGSSFGLIKMSKSKPKDVSYPLQWMNHVKDFGLVRKLINSYTGENSKSYNILAGLMKLTKNPEGISKFADRLKERFPTEVNNAVYENSKLGGGLHAANASVLDILSKSNVVEPALKLGGQTGSILYMAPNYRGDLAENEIAVDRDLMIKLVPAFKKSTSTEAMNDYLSKNDFRLLGYRTPVAYVGGANYVRVKRVHDIEGTVQLHPNMVARNMEGDYDGDTFAVLKMPDELDKPLKDYFNSSQYTKNIKSLDLKKYVSDMQRNAGKFLDRNSTMDAILYSENAVQDIAALQSLLGMFRNNFDYISFGKARIQPVKGQVDLGFIKGTPDEILRIYLQAAVDNSKYLLLQSWGYDRDVLISNLFEISNASNRSLSDLSNSGAFKVLNSTLNKYRTLRSIKSGAISKNVSGLIKEANYYFAEKKGSQIKFPEGRTGDQSLMEASVQNLVTVYDNFILSDPNTADSRISAFEFPMHAHSNAHITALKNLNVKENLDSLTNQGYGKSINFINKILNKTRIGLTTKKGRIRPIQAKSWESNEKLVDIIYELEENRVTDSNELKAITYAMLNNINLNLLEGMPPSRYFDQTIMKQYYKEYTDKLTENISDDNIVNTDLESFKKGRC